VNFHLLYTGEIWGDVTGGLRRGAAYDGLITLKLQLDLAKLAHLEGLAFYASGLYPNGPGISNHYTGDYNLLSNIDAYDSPRLFEAYLLWSCCDNKFTIRAGQLSFDTYFFVSDSSNLFINSAFGTIGTVLHDVIPPIYPVGAPGVHLTFQPAPDWQVQAIVVSGNPGDQARDNQDGLKFAVNTSAGALAALEVGFTHSASPAEAGLQAKYKLGVYCDTGDYADHHGGPTHHGNYGIYTVLDQQLYRSPRSTRDQFDGLSAFLRTSMAPEDRNPVACYFDTGINFTGPFPGREKDICGVAFSFSQLSSGLQQPDGSPAVSRHEHVLEATYLYNLSDAVSFQPDVQYIFNPGAVGKTPNALVAGLRFNFTF
jgi:porin